MEAMTLPTVAFFSGLVQNLLPCLLKQKWDWEYEWGGPRHIAINKRYYTQSDAEGCLSREARQKPKERKKIQRSLPL